MRSMRLWELAGSASVSERYRPLKPSTHRPPPITRNISERTHSGRNCSVATVTHAGATTIRYAPVMAKPRPRLTTTMPSSSTRNQRLTWRPGRISFRIGLILLSKNPRGNETHNADQQRAEKRGAEVCDLHAATLNDARQPEHNRVHDQ